MASHKQACSRAMFQLGRCYGLAGSNLFLRIARKPFAQCSNCVTATASHKQACSRAMFQLGHCYGLAESNLFLRIARKPFVQCSKCAIATALHNQACSCQSPESPSCNVPIVSLLWPHRNKPVLANRQKALVQCSNRVIAAASHEQACSCQSPESPSCNVPIVSLLRPRIIKLVLANRQKALRAMFQLCHCCCLAETNVFLPIARKPSCNVPIVSLLRLRINQPVLANRQRTLVQCSNRVIATASHEQACSCQSPESPRAMFQFCHCYCLAQTSLILVNRQKALRAMFQLCHCYGFAWKKPVLANRPKALRAMFQLCHCYGLAQTSLFCQSPESNCVIATATHKQACSCQSPESPSCNVPFVSLLRPRRNKLVFANRQKSPSCNVPIVSLLLPRRNKPVFANRQKVFVQCSNRVIATASHEQACSCQSPESPSCNVPIVSLLLLRINKLVLANRQTDLVHCSNCVAATASHNDACSCQSPDSHRAMFQLCHCYSLA